jgi:hypothetical protein
MAVLFKYGSIARITTFLMVAAVLATALSMVVPRSVSAQVGPHPVDGFVTDQAGRPIEGADVSVVMKNGATLVDTQTFTSLSNGFYAVTFGDGMWAPGFTIISTATFNSAQQSNSTLCTDDFQQHIDIKFPYEIPQFGSIIGFVVAAALVGVVAVVFLARKIK